MNEEAPEQESAKQIWFLSPDKSLISRTLKPQEDKPEGRRYAEDEKEEEEGNIEIQITPDNIHNRALELLTPRNSSTSSTNSESSVSNFQTVYELISRKRETKLLPLLIVKIMGLLYLLIEMTVKCRIDNP